MSITYRSDYDLDFDQLAAMFVDAGWRGRAANRGDFEAMVRGSRFVVSAWDGDALVGFARASSDAVSTAYVSDVVVRRDHRRSGIGAEVMRRILGHHTGIKFVLHATPEHHAFYKKLGFVDAPNMLVRKRDGES